MDYGVPLGRRLRLKLWFVMRYGHEGLAAIIRQQIGGRRTGRANRRPSAL
jgi:hypothetical protein